jgi:hypothetical protein
MQYPCFDLAEELGFAILGGIYSMPKRLRCNVLFIPSIAGDSGSPEEGSTLPPRGTETAEAPHPERFL